MTSVRRGRGQRAQSGPGVGRGGWGLELDLEEPLRV